MYIYALSSLTIRKQSLARVNCKTSNWLSFGVTFRERKQTWSCTLSSSNIVYTMLFTKLKIFSFLFSIALTMNSRLYFMAAFAFEITGKDYFSHGRTKYSINRLKLHILLQFRDMITVTSHRRQPPYPLGSPLEQLAEWCIRIYYDI